MVLWAHVTLRDKSDSGMGVLGGGLGLGLDDVLGLGLVGRGFGGRQPPDLRLSL